MEISFKMARDSDIDMLLAFMRQFYEIDHYPFDEQKARAALRELTSNPSLGRVWIIAEGASPVGYLVLTLSYCLEYHGRDAFIDEIFIQHDYRGRGIGKEAMRFVEEASRELGVNALHLEVERGNRAGQALYRKAGFKDHDRYLMTKWLKG